jgi:3-phosphoshikimate 1-carboxyvinyltransferase
VIQALGASARWHGDVVEIGGRGLDLGPGTPVALDCANSGTTMRLGAGLVAARPGDVTLDGDGSLRRRPMERVAAPLRLMGAHIDTHEGRPPLRVRGTTLRAIDYELPVASAQVKSAVLLAGLRTAGETRVREPLTTRDHTERMLAAMGGAVSRQATTVTVRGGVALRPLTLRLPADPSAAAFFAVAASLVDGAELVLRDVGTNPTRTGGLELLARMGAHVEWQEAREDGGEPRADVVVRGGRLRGIVIDPSDVPGAIDELPVLAVAAAFAAGETRLSGAAELRVKESDRLEALAQLGDVGADVRITDDGFVIHGTGGRPLRGGRVAAGGDHRIAMAFAVAGLQSERGIEIDDPECARVSFPGFFERLVELGAQVEPV